MSAACLWHADTHQHFLFVLIRVDSWTNLRILREEAMADLIYKDECYAIVGAAMEVYNEMGHGFLEPVYQECMEIEMGEMAIPFDNHVPLNLTYKGRPLSQGYVPDFLCYGKIIVELKALTALADPHRAQVINYLKASGMKLGVLINFGAPGGLQFERIVL